MTGKGLLPRYFRDNGEFLEKEKLDLKIAIVVLWKMNKLPFGRKNLPAIFIKKVFSENKLFSKKTLDTDVNLLYKQGSNSL